MHWLFCFYIVAMFDNMEKYNRDEPKKPDKPFNPLESWKIKHCDLFDKCSDNCSECLFNALYHLNPKEWEAPNEWNFWDLASNEY